MRIHVPVCAPAQTDQCLCFSLLRNAHTLYKLATSEISMFYLVNVAKETGLSIALLETPKIGSLTSRPK